MDIDQTHTDKETVEELIVIEEIGAGSEIIEVIDIEENSIDPSKDHKHHKPETVTIIVEGTPHEWPKHEPITFAQVVTFEFPDYAQHPEITYSVKYADGPSHKPAGILVRGASVHVKEGMFFNVSRTGQS